MLESLQSKLRLYKYTVIAFGILSCTLIVMFLYIRDLKKQNTALAQQVSTTSEQFQKIGDSYQAQGIAFKTEKEAWAKATKDLGVTLTASMAQSQAQLQVLYNAVGILQSQLGQGTSPAVTPAPSGAFKGVTLVQARKGPALSEVSLTYDPAAQDPTKRLAPQWLSYQEEFDVAMGEWKKKDGGFVAALRMTRKVLRPDKDGLKVVGEEDIPIGTATASFGPSAFGGEQALAPVPRFTVFGGAGWDTDKKKAVPVLGMDYRLTTNTGIGAGIAGNIVFGSLSYRFGK